MKTIEDVYNQIKRKIGEIKVSEFLNSGSVMCALITKSGKIYFGSNIQASCGLSICAERIAIYNAILANDMDFKSILCVFKDGSIITPCGSCRELLMQTGKKNLNLEIITSINPYMSIKLCELMSNWWGNYRY